MIKDLFYDTIFSLIGLSIVIFVVIVIVITINIFYDLFNNDN